VLDRDADVVFVLYPPAFYSFDLITGLNKILPTDESRGLRKKCWRIYGQVNYSFWRRCMHRRIGSLATQDVGNKFYIDDKY